MSNTQCLGGSQIILLTKITYFWTVSFHEIRLIGTSVFSSPKTAVNRFINTSLIVYRNNGFALITAFHTILTHVSLTSRIAAFSNFGPLSTIFVEICTIWHWTRINAQGQIENKEYHCTCPERFEFLSSGKLVKTYPAEIIIRIGYF